MVFRTRGRTNWSWLALLGIALAASIAVAQGDPAATTCDLPLPVPATTDVEIELQPNNRGPGLLLTWPEPVDAMSTCVAVLDTAGLGVGIAFTGDYADGFDRTLEFRFATGGVIGDSARNRFLCSWSNRNAARTGQLGGEFNLSNTGGMWRREGGGAWVQSNAGLPTFLPYTNLIDVALANDGFAVALLTAGALIGNDPVGVFVSDGGAAWSEIGADVFGRSRKITAVGIDPDNRDRIAVGTANDGVWISGDGGASFTQWTDNLDPGATDLPNTYTVSTISWTAARLAVAIDDFGLFFSADGGSTFDRISSLRIPSRPGHLWEAFGDPIPVHNPSTGRPFPCLVVNSDVEADSGLESLITVDWQPGLTATFDLFPAVGDPLGQPFSGGGAGFGLADGPVAGIRWRWDDDGHFDFTGVGAESALIISDPSWVSCRVEVNELYECLFFIEGQLLHTSEPITNPQEPVRFFVAGGGILVDNTHVFINDVEDQTILVDDFDVDLIRKTVRPQVNVVVDGPAGNNNLLVGLANHGVWESVDGGANWHSLIVDYDGAPTGWRYSVLSLLVDSAGGTIYVGTEARRLLRSVDGGSTWDQSATPFDEELILPEIAAITVSDGAVLALADGFGIIETMDQGLTWAEVADQPFNRRGRRLLSANGTLLLPTTSGGTYTPGTTIELSETIVASTTDEELLDLDLGLSLTFSEGEIVLVDADDDDVLDIRVFNVVCQDYQGWAVWRSARGDADNMSMIGRYDKNNPETCIEGFCGDDNYVVLPNCFSERRAACFDVSVPGQISFFDDEVNNGFTYFYAVTPFDYGDISLVSDPISVSTPLVFPARFPGDPAAIVDGPGNRVSFQVNVDATAAADGGEIYAYPNPLRLDSGIVGGEGEEVIWTNLPPESTIQVFTLAGDEIATLPEEDSPQRGGNIFWVARNDDEQLLASGIYIWRVMMPERNDFWGKLVIIR